MGGFDGALDAFEPAIEKEFSASLPRSCLSPAERMKHVEKALALASEGRLKAGETFKLIEQERKAHDPRPDCVELSCDGLDEDYFQPDEITSPLISVRNSYEDYACSLEQAKVRLEGIKMRLNQRDPLESESTGRCGPEKSLPPTSTTPVLPIGYPASDVSGT